MRPGSYAGLRPRESEGVEGVKRSYPLTTLYYPLTTCGRKPA
nr:MAG TPA: hypothetical protein [Caudoviricetes sp.]